jgi:hypothetical protein
MDDILQLCGNKVVLAQLLTQLPTIFPVSGLNDNSNPLLLLFIKVIIFLNYGLPDCEKFFPLEKCTEATLCRFVP